MAVVVNDMSEVNIGAALVEISKDGIGCTLREDLLMKVENWQRHYIESQNLRKKMAFEEQCDLMYTPG